LFEIGSVYGLSGDERIEPVRACLGATFSAVRDALPANETLDVSKGERAASAEAFRGFKGDVENLLAAFAGAITFDRGTPEYFHPGRSARAAVNGRMVAQFGEIHPEIVSARKLRQPVFLAEFDLEQLYKMGLRPVRFEPLPKYPAVERDFSFVFGDDVSFEQIERAMANTAITELREFCPAEIFRGGSIASGKYSVLLRAKFQSGERTLREDEVSRWSSQIVAALTHLGGVQRA
jgi:phenylalanyl-tRNA synthetase beta chain